MNLKFLQRFSAGVLGLGLLIGCGGSVGTGTEGSTTVSEVPITEAVTTTRLLWRCAETLAITSIHASNCPPNKFPKVFVSLGSTTFVVMERVSDARLDFMQFVLTKVQFFGA